MCGLDVLPRPAEVQVGGGDPDDAGRFGVDAVRAGADGLGIVVGVGVGVEECAAVVDQAPRVHWQAAYPAAIDRMEVKWP